MRTGDMRDPARLHVVTLAVTEWEAREALDFIREARREAASGETGYEVTGTLERMFEAIDRGTGEGHGK